MGRSTKTMAAARHRRICQLVAEHGSVTVPWLAETLGVGASTIRHDLGVLHEQGKVLRSHGGAVSKDSGISRMPYSETRSRNAAQKAWIGQAAASLLPENAYVFLGAGTTVLEMVHRIPESRPINVVTASADIVVHLFSNQKAAVDLIGGRMRRDCPATDGSWSEDVLERVYWDITFMGAPAIDPVRGISTVDRSVAAFDLKMIEHAAKTVVLCDSSKLGQFSYVKVAPVSAIDVLITDENADPVILDAFLDEGVQVIVTSPNGESISHKDSGATSNGSVNADVPEPVT